MDEISLYKKSKKTKKNVRNFPNSAIFLQCQFCILDVIIRVVHIKIEEILGGKRHNITN